MAQCLARAVKGFARPWSDGVGKSGLLLRMLDPRSLRFGGMMVEPIDSLRSTCEALGKCWAKLVAKKEGKRRSVAQQMSEILRQWQAALDSADPQRRSKN